MMTTGCRSEKVTRTGFYEESVRVAAKSVEKMQNVIDATLEASCLLQLDVESAPYVVKISLREYCSIKETYSNEPENFHDLEMGFWSVPERESGAG